MDNVIGSVNVEVKASLAVDEDTFRTCLNLIGLYVRSKGNKVMIAQFDECYMNGCAFTFFPNEEEYEDFLRGDNNV